MWIHTDVSSYTQLHVPLELLQATNRTFTSQRLNVGFNGERENNNSRPRCKALVTMVNVPYI